MFKNTKPIVFLTVLFLLFVFCNGVVMLSLLRNDSKPDVAQTSSVKEANVKPISPSLITKVDPSSNGSLKGNIQVGNIVTFGRYYSANDKVKVPLRWRVLSVEGNKALLITENCIDAMSYHHEYVAIDWEHSDIRKWLNHDFIDMAFNRSEQKELLATNNINNAGAITRDSVFLLSIDEAKKYFHSDEERMCEVTPYAKNGGAFVYPENTMYGWWWLRSRGCYDDDAAVVNVDGHVDGGGLVVNDANASVRPALWLNL